MTTMPHPTSLEAIYQARWLTPDGVQVLSPGCLHVRAGRIVRVWEGTDDSAVDLGDVVITPGLVNAHTHLEFSDLAQPLSPGAAFPDWIRSVIQSRRQRADDGHEAIARGWEECRLAGVAAVGEIATADESIEVLSAHGGAGVVFREVLGLQPESIESGLEIARRYLQACSTETSMELTVPSLRRGLSPHAPYSLHPRLFRGLIDLAARSGAPVAMHLAETREELELLSQHSGGLVDLLRSLGLWRAEAFREFRRPLDYLHELSRCARTLVVHGNYLTAEEMDFLSTQPRMSVVYCPRTHASFGHEPHPWRALRERGVRVVLGTDSRASNPDLSLVSEVRWLQRKFPCVAPGSLLRMVTIEAAEALGLSEVWGPLTPGHWATWSLIAPAADVMGVDFTGLWTVD